MKYNTAIYMFSNEERRIIISQWSTHTLCMQNNNTPVPPGLMLMNILPYVNSYTIILNILIHNEVHNVLANVVIATYGADMVQSLANGKH